MKKKKRVVDVVRDIAKPVAEANNLELVDVEFVKEGPFRYLRVTIDKEEGVSTDDCSTISREINSKLDEFDLIEENYFLEVTSPGVERVLKTEADFAKFSGKEIQINLYQPYEGQKSLRGVLLGLKDGIVSIKIDNKEEVEIAHSQISLAKLYVDFDLKEVD